MSQETAEVVRTAFESYLEDVDGYQLEDIGVVDDAETNEQFLEVIVSVTLGGKQENDPKEFIRPVFQAYARLVVEAGLDFPLESVLCIRDDEAGFRTHPFLGFRASTMWVREHAHDNYSLQETLDRVFGTIHRADGTTPDAIQGWVPEYDLDWRQQDPTLDPDDFDKPISYDHWAGKQVDPPSSNGT